MAPGALRCLDADIGTHTQQKGTNMDMHDLSAEEILYARDVDARIEELENTEPEDEDEAEEISEELAELTQFRNEASGQFTWNPGGMSFIRDSYWEKYAAQRANDIYGEVTETEYWLDARWASDLQEGFQEIVLDGVTFLYDGN